MDKLKSGPMITLITIVVLINLFAAIITTTITGRIDEARQLYEAVYGSVLILILFFGCVRKSLLEGIN